MSNYYLCNTAALAVNLTPSAYRVYHLLSSMADNKTRETYPSKTYMAAQLGVSTKTIQRATKSLVKAGLLTITNAFRPKNKMQSANIYTLLDQPQLSMNQSANPASPKSKLNRIYKTSSSLSLSGGALKTYCYLKSHTDKNGLCYTYICQIAQRLQRSKRTIQRYIQELTQRGLLHIERIKGDKNIYRIQKAPVSAPEHRKSIKKCSGKKCAILEASTSDVRRQEQFLLHTLRTAIFQILCLRI